MNRGEVHLADFGEPLGHEQGFERPVVVMSAQPWLESNPPVVAVIPLTSTPSERVTHVEVDAAASGLDVTSYAKCEDLRAVSPRRVQRRLGATEDIAMLRIETIVKRLLAL